MMTVAKRFASRLRGRRIHQPSVKRKHIHLGSEYGGWPVIPELLSSESTVLSFGLGTDITFDVGMIEKFGCRVVGFDPTPRSTAWLAKQALPKLFTYHQIGIAAHDGEIDFFPPDNPEQVSFSASRGNFAPVRAAVLSLSSILKKFDFPVPDVLKMDIEGFEYDVLDDIIRSEIRPTQLLVEFHHTMYGINRSKTDQTVSRLIGSGYELFYVSDGGLEYGFSL